MDIVLCMDILENPYLGDNLSKGFETLQASQSDGGLRVGKVSSLNSKLSVYRKSGILQENYSKKSISQPNRNLGPYPFRPFLVYATPTCGQNLSSKAFQHLKRFPRQFQGYICHCSLAVSITLSLPWHVGNGLWGDSNFYPYTSTLRLGHVSKNFSITFSKTDSDLFFVIFLWNSLLTPNSFQLIFVSRQV